MSITLDGIGLPEDLEWIDEYGSSLVHAQVRKSLTGALIIEESAQQAGRLMTFEGKQDAAWIDKTTLDLLRVKTETAGLTMALTYYGQAFNVRFRRDVQPIEAALIIDYANPDATDRYSFKLSLMAV